VYFVTSVEEERADAALDGMFKFLAAQENDTIRERTIRQVEYQCFGNSDLLYPESVGSVDPESGSESMGGQHSIAPKNEEISCFLKSLMFS
jgi:hypothetical protein